MKPILIIPPAPARWPAFEDLLRHEGTPWLLDLKRRLVDGVPGAQDAYAVMLSGNRILASVAINKFGDVGLLTHGYTREEHRRRGAARKLVETAVSWFSMTGGRWLFLGTTAEFDEGFYRKFGFTPLRRAVWKPYDRLTMLRTTPGAAESPQADSAGEIVTRDLSRAEWPAMVALLQYSRGPDPRVPLDESAVSAPMFTLDLIEHQERGACQLKGAFCGSRLVGVATIATDQAGERTYAMLIPHVDAPQTLRDAVIDFAKTKGYARVDFPMEALGGRPADVPAAAREESEPPPPKDADTPPDQTAPADS